MNQYSPREYTDEELKHFAEMIQKIMPKSPITLKIADFLSQGEDLELEAAMEFYRDVSIENVMQIEFVRYLDKLAKRIKDYIKNTGERGDVSGINMTITPTKGRKSANVAGLEEFAGLLEHKYPEVDPLILEAIRANILGNINQGKPGTRISMKVE